MDLRPPPFDAPLDRYESQARKLLAGHASGDPEAIGVFHRHHPRFLDEKIPWLPRPMPDSAIQEASLDIGDARLALARSYNFRDWAALSDYVEQAARPGSPVFLFESAVEAVVSGDLAGLRRLLGAHPELIRARSTRITNFDPPVHRATLLHYTAANGVEDYRQRTPANAVDIAKALLDAGAEADALASMYGGECTTLSMLVSSSHPAKAGLQVVMADLLLDHGASVEGRGEGNWQSPLHTALVFGYRDAAEVLARRGARVDTLAAAAGLGRAGEVRRLLDAAGAAERHRALALAAQLGHAEIVGLLLDSGEDPNRFNPGGYHSHSTPLHQAALAGHSEAVRVLVERGARLDIRDTVHGGTPLGWAEHGGHAGIAGYLRARGGNGIN